jgi:undecaprenyl diphosphate synthase
MSLLQKVRGWKESPVITDEDLKKLYPSPVPKHVAFIPDGNRRWAKKNCILPEEGHKLGADSLLNIIKAGHQMGIETLTFFIFSTENWARPQKEIDAQMKLLEKSLLLQRPRMLENGVRFRSIGDLSKFPPHLVELIESTKKETEHCDKITVVFAMNYGGRDDIRRAVVKMIDSHDKGDLKKEEITEEVVKCYLDTASLSDPDLLIRTSGESRLSNFLLWQLSYAEIYLTEKYWPEFTPIDFLEAVRSFQNRDRRLGGS